MENLATFDSRRVTGKFWAVPGNGKSIIPKSFLDCENVFFHHSGNDGSILRIITIWWYYTVIYWDFMVGKPISKAEFDDGWLLKLGKLLGQFSNMSMNFPNDVCKSALHWICWDTVGKNSHEMNNLRHLKTWGSWMVIGVLSFLASTDHP